MWVVFLSLGASASLWAGAQVRPVELCGLTHDQTPAPRGASASAAARGSKDHGSPGLWSRSGQLSTGPVAVAALLSWSCVWPRPRTSRGGHQSPGRSCWNGPWSSGLPASAGASGLLPAPGAAGAFRVPSAPALTSCPRTPLMGAWGPGSPDLKRAPPRVQVLGSGCSVGAGGAGGHLRR